MTVTLPLELNDFRPVAVDLYRDIHKGIRAELFELTRSAGSIDPSDRVSRAAVADHVRSVVELLVSHAHHEDAAIQPALEVHLPTLAEAVEQDHFTIDGRLVGLQDLAEEVADATRADQRPMAHRLYLELASFTASYLEHQHCEEWVIMPALEAAIGPEAVLDIHQAIVGAIPPEEMARSLAIMLPAMNLDDRAELLGGMQAGAPPEVFAGVWGLAGSALPAADHAALGARLGLGA